jgi:hypothetical protein
VPPMPRVDPDDVQAIWTLRLIDILNRLAPLVRQPVIQPWPPHSPDLNLEIVCALVDACIARLTAPAQEPAPVEAPAASASGRKPGYGALTAKVRVALQAHGQDGSTNGALAKQVDTPRNAVWQILERLVKQGKAQKNGTTYRWVA